MIHSNCFLALGGLGCPAFFKVKWLGALNALHSLAKKNQVTILANEIAQLGRYLALT